MAVITLVFIASCRHHGLKEGMDVSSFTPMSDRLMGSWEGRSDLMDAQIRLTRVQRSMWRSGVARSYWTTRHRYGLPHIQNMDENSCNFVLTNERSSAVTLMGSLKAFEHW